MKEKQQQLLFDKGITNVPSDALCSDNALAESVGMVYDDGEHRVIQAPAVQMETGLSWSARILYIHKFNDAKRYIYILSQNGENDVLEWGEKESGQLTQDGAFQEVDVSDTSKLHITSIGKTLVVSDRNELHYYLWTADGYKSLGPIPVPKPEYQMCVFEVNDEPEIVTNPPYISEIAPNPEYNYRERTDVVKHTQSFDGIFATSGKDKPIEPNTETDEPWQEKHQEDYNNLVIGCYSKNKKSVAQNNCFCNPFFVRVALELYDGSYYHVGSPMLMLPSVEANSWARLSDGYNFTLYTICRQLAVKQSQDYSDWSDIVKDVVLFVTDDIDVNETTMDIPIYKSNGKFSVTGYYSSSIGGIWHKEIITQDEAGTIDGVPYGKLVDDEDDIIYHFNPFKSRTNADMNASIEGMSVFYKLCSIGIKSIGWTSTREKIDKHTLENITTQDQLEYDDYFSGCPIKAGSVYSYNARLNLANIERGFFNGYDISYAYTVDIDINGETKRITHSQTQGQAAQCFYFFYPDPRAKKFGTHELKEHPGLNGAYYFAGLENVPNMGDTINTYTIPNPFEGDFESLPNTLVVSEANNPFVFYAHGYNNIGFGVIVGMSSITQAISEGQFGQYPLLVFSTDGIWAMSVSKEGYYSYSHPMSREVCNNPNSITQTDGAVFFSSEKGLMAVFGNQVKCVSEQLSGKTETTSGVENIGNFHEYLKDCFIAYDYRDSLLWIFKENETYCWVYSIKSGTFGKYHLSANDVVNDYPDYLISQNDKFLSFTERKDINKDQNSYSGKIISRPMKLENALALKSIMQVKHIHDMNANAALALRIFASNNLKNWVELHSLRGTPWKYFRFRYDFTGLKATDRFAGTMLITQERRTDKLR